MLYSRGFAVSVLACALLVQATSLFGVAQARASYGDRQSDQQHADQGAYTDEQSQQSDSSSTQDGYDRSDTQRTQDGNDRYDTNHDSQQNAWQDWHGGNRGGNEREDRHHDATDGNNSDGSGTTSTSTAATSTDPVVSGGGDGGGTSTSTATSTDGTTSSGGDGSGATTSTSTEATSTSPVEGGGDSHPPQVTHVSGGGGGVVGGPLSVGYVAVNPMYPASADEVLGTSTSATSTTCGPLLHSYLRFGIKNDSSEVQKLQGFLNANLGTTLTSGVFDANTTAAVKRFQLKYWDEVLKPWVSRGLSSDHTATGYVFKTTLRKINNLYCPALQLPVPTL